MQNAKAQEFKKLHVAGKPLIVFNAWDAGSAKVVATSGAKVVGTSSWAVAEALGYSDGEQTPLELVIENLRRIVRVTDLPVTIDLESGYGDDPADVANAVGLAIAAGAVGCNLEDSFPSNGKLRSLDEQVARIRAARQAAKDSGVDFFINARCDVFFQGPAEQHDATWADDAIARGDRYAEAGADGLFLPGLKNDALIRKVVRGASLPLNILVSGATPDLAVMTDSGVARLSYGGTPYANAMRSLEEAARNANT